jgi:P-type E1-E2 ATPase
MALRREIPGLGEIQLEHLLLDLNGTTSAWGAVGDGIRGRLRDLSEELTVHLLSADTYGTLTETAGSLEIASRVVHDGVDKHTAVVELGAEGCAAIGNGANDAAMLKAARIGIAVLGGEGLAASALRAADVLCGSMTEALDLLIHEAGLAATLRP